jgi:hypothetical protein
MSRKILFLKLSVSAFIVILLFKFLPPKEYSSIKDSAVILISDRTYVLFISIVCLLLLWGMSFIFRSSFFNIIKPKLINNHILKACLKFLKGEGELNLNFWKQSIFSFKISKYGLLTFFILLIALIQVTTLWDFRREEVDENALFHFALGFSEAILILNGMDMAISVCT